jgi:hypothetical protein
VYRNKGLTRFSGFEGLRSGVNRVKGEGFTKTGAGSPGLLKGSYLPEVVKERGLVGLEQVSRASWDGHTSVLLQVELYCRRLAVPCL